MLEDTDVVYVARFPADRVMTVSMDVGSRRPAYCTAMGRVLLGELPEPRRARILDRSLLVAHTPRTVVDKEALMEEFRKARRQGHAIVDQELEDGLVAVSVPLRDCTRRRAGRRQRVRARLATQRSTTWNAAVCRRFASAVRGSRARVV